MTASEQPTSVATERRMISRRTVVRTGAHAAWAVPAISVATAAPALAASGQPDLDGSGITAIFYSPRKKKNWRLIITINPITNKGPGPVGAITLLLRVPKKRNGSLKKKPRYIKKTGAGWRFVRSYKANGRWTYVFTYGRGLAQGEQTPTLTVYLKPRPQQASAARGHGLLHRSRDAVLTRPAAAPRSFGTDPLPHDISTAPPRRSH